MMNLKKYLIAVLLLITNGLMSYAQKIVTEQSADQINNKYYTILDFNELPSVDLKNSLKLKGINLYDYLGGNSYLACLHQNFIERSNEFLDMHKLTNDLRFSDEIKSGQLCDAETKGLSKFSIQYLPEVELEYIRQQCDQLQIKIIKISEIHRAIFVQGNLNSISKLKSLLWVQNLSCTALPGEPEDREGRSMHRVNQISGSTSNGINLDGSGVNVLVRDDGPIGPHIDFQTRLTNLTFGLDGNHGDGVSGIICGAANIDPTVEGMAPAATLYAIDYQDDFLDNTEDLHKNNKVMVTNSSYSNGCNGGYTIITQIVDKMCSDNPTLLHCFSAGNSNNLDCGYGAGNQWGNITGGHKIGKNVITAANLMINGIVDASSSRGPTKDGRMKPDVSSRGTNEISSDIGNTYQVFGGTSAASPGVAGTATLLYQAFRNFNNQMNPSSALIKSCLMNTATDIGTPGPDYVYGFGQIDGFRAYNQLKEKRYQELNVKQNDVIQIPINVPTNCAIAKFMIYWPEKEASLNARKALINDIDLEVLSPTGTIILPLVLDPSPNETTLAEGAKPGIDTLNNFEQVSILFPMAGTYTIRIKGKSLPDANVPCLLLYDFPENKLSITSPSGNELFTTLESTYIYYNAYGTDTIKFEFSSDNGQTWKSIKSIPANTRLTNWSTPNNINSNACIIRITQGNQLAESGKFTISNPLTGLKIANYCPNELTLTWSQSLKDSFLIYGLQGASMKVIGSSNTNTFVVPIKSRKDPLWFSVAGYRDGILGRRTKAIGVPDTLVKCSIKNDLSIRPKNEYLNTQSYITCGSGTFSQAEFIIHNRNVNEVNSFILKYEQGNKVVSQLVNKKLKYRDSVTVKTIEGFNLDFEGEKTFKIWIELATDEFPLNDSTSITIKNYLIKNSNGVYPMIENFESNGIPNDWIITSAIPNSNWVVQDQLDKNASLSKMVGFENNNYSYTGTSLGLITKTIDLSNSIEPYFYMDFAYHKSTYVASYYDTLKIELLEVCSGNTNVYKLFTSAESSLYTTPQTSEVNWIPSKADMWKTLGIDLSAYKGKKIVLRVNLIRGVFSNIYLDNIKVVEKEVSSPKLSFSWDPNDFCVTNFVKFTGNNGGTTQVLNWNFGQDAAPLIATGSGPISVKYTTAGLKTVSLTTQVGNQINVISKNLFAYLFPLASFDYSVSPTNLVSFTNYSTNIKDVLWDFGDGTTSTEVNPTHQFDSSKIYKVVLTIVNPCATNRLNLDVDLKLVGINDLSKDNFMVKPNPSTGWVEILSNDDIQELQISSMDGKLLATKKYLKAVRKVGLDLSTYAKGVYIIKCNSVKSSSAKTILLMD